MTTPLLIQFSRHWNLQGHQHPVYALEVDADGETIYSAGGDKGVVAWDIRLGTFKHVVVPVPSTVYVLKALKGTPYLCAGLSSGEVLVIDPKAQKILRVLKFHEKPVFSLAFIESKSELLIGSEDGVISIWSIPAFEKVYTLPLSHSTIRVMVVDAENRQVVVGDKGGMLHILDASDYRLLTSWQGHTQSVTSLAISSNDQQLLTGGRDARLVVYKGVSNQKLTEFVPHMFAVYGIAFHPVWPIFATISRDKSIKIWSSDTFRLLKTWSREKGNESHALSINCVIWHPITHQLLTAGDDRMIMAWDVKIPSLLTT